MFTGNISLATVVSLVLTFIKPARITNHVLLQTLITTFSKVLIRCLSNLGLYFVYRLA